MALIDIVNRIIEILGVIVVVAPVALKFFKLLAASTHNKRLINLATRADIIVQALEQSGLIGEDKKLMAIDKLQQYANETKIKINVQQAEDYIEAAVYAMKQMQTPKADEPINIKINETNK